MLKSSIVFIPLTPTALPWTCYNTQNASFLFTYLEHAKPPSAYFDSILVQSTEKHLWMSLNKQSV